MFNKLFLGFINVFSKLFSNFLLLKIISIYLGTSGIGIYSQYRSFWQFSSTITTFNSGAFVIQKLSNSQNNSLFFLASFISIFLFNIIFSIVILCNLEFLSLKIFLSTDIFFQNILIYSAFIIPLSSIILLILNSLNGFKRFYLYTLFSFLIMLIYIFVSLFYAYFFINSFEQILKIILISEILTIIMLIINFRYTLKKIILSKINFLLLKLEIIKFIKISTFFLFSGSFFLISILLIKIFIIHEFGYSGLGLFESAWSLSLVISFITLRSLSFYYLPDLSSMTNINFNKLINNYFLISPIIILFLFVPVIIFNKYLIIFFFTSDFNSAFVYLRWLIVAEVVKLFGHLFAYPIISQSKYKFYLTLEFLNTLFFLVLSFLSITYLKNIELLTISYLITNSLYVIVAFIYVSKVFKFKLVKNNIKILFLIIPFIIVISVINWNQEIYIFYNLLSITIYVFFLLLINKFKFKLNYL